MYSPHQVWWPCALDSDCELCGAASVRAVTFSHATYSYRSMAETVADPEKQSSAFLRQLILDNTTEDAVKGAALDVIIDRQAAAESRAAAAAAQAAIATSLAEQAILDAQKVLRACGWCDQALLLDALLHRLHTAVTSFSGTSSAYPGAAQCSGSKWQQLQQEPGSTRLCALITEIYLTAGLLLSCK